METAQAKVEEEKIKIVRARTMNQKDLDSSCWSIQIWGPEYCKNCEFKNTSDCGGQTGNAKLIREGKTKVKSREI